MAAALRLPPWSAATWVNCPGSALNQQGYPRTDSSHQSEGREAHDYAAQWIKTGEPHFTMDEKMRRHLQVYIDDIRSFNPSYILAESKISLKDGPIDMYGYLDCTTSFETEQYHLVRIWDLKWGFFPIAAYENWQLLLYAIALEKQYTGTKQLFFDLRIVQPRAFGKNIVDSWLISAEQLEQYKTKVYDAATKAQLPKPPIVAGSWCFFCKAFLDCPSAEKVTALSIDFSETAEKFPATAEEVGRKLMLLQRAEVAIKRARQAMESHAEGFVIKGRPIPGYCMEPGKGKRMWRAGTEEQIKSIAAHLKKEVVKPQELITPTQAINAGIPEELVRAYSEYVVGAPKLKKINLQELERIFPND